MARKKNINWNLPEEPSWEQATLAVLMDLRDELQQMNEVMFVLRARLNCSDTLAIPRYLAKIAKNTTKPKRRKTRGKT